MIVLPWWSVIVHGALALLVLVWASYVLFRINRSRRLTLMAINWLMSVIPDAGDTLPAFQGAPPLPGKDRYVTRRRRRRRREEQLEPPGEEWEEELDEDSELSTTHPVVTVDDEFLQQLEEAQRGELAELTEEQAHNVRADLAKKDLTHLMGSASGPEGD